MMRWIELDAAERSPSARLGRGPHQGVALTPPGSGVIPTGVWCIFERGRATLIDANRVGGGLVKPIPARYYKGRCS